MNDMNLLLVGGNGLIRVVLVVKWRRRQGNRVSGTVELFMRDRQGMPQLRQTEVCSKLLINLSHTYYLEFVQTVFPAPPPGTNQQLGIRRRDLFGQALVSGRNPNDILYLDIDRLRYYAADSLQRMNLVPA
jgi:hypothetical protein